MKKLVILLICVCFLAGCNGVWMNAEYSSVLDQTTALSETTAARANDGTLSCDEMKTALTLQAETWKQFKNAKDGVK